MVPVRNDPENLARCLRALAKTDYSNFEVIVVDDASTDQTGSVASSLGCRVVTLDQQSGPALARNYGAEAARSGLILFVDADVCVSPKTIGQFIEIFEGESDVAAVFGSYDAVPDKLNLISQYKNLLHHFVHQNGNHNASTFWAGCGAIRRPLFLEVNGFDTKHQRPCIEDIELGVRLRKAGYKIKLDPNIQVTHLKHWTLWEWIRTDIFDRAIPWTRLILNENMALYDLNLSISQRFSAILCCGLLILFLVGSWHEPWLLFLPCFGLFVMLLVDHCGHQDWRGYVMSVFFALLAIGCFAGLALRFEWWMLAPALIVLVVVIVNFGLFRFFARSHHLMFALMVVPLHILYFTYSSAVFGVCLIWHLLTRVASPQVKAAQQ